MANRTRTNRRASAPKVVHQVEYEKQQLQQHTRLLRVIEPYFGKGCATVGEAVLAAAQDHGIDATGRDTEELVPLVLAAAETGRRPA